jgi:hypothetical protein
MNSVRDVAMWGSRSMYERTAAKKSMQRRRRFRLKLFNALLSLDFADQSHT